MAAIILLLICCVQAVAAQTTSPPREVKGLVIALFGVNTAFATLIAVQSIVCVCRLLIFERTPDRSRLLHGAYGVLLTALNFTATAYGVVASIYGLYAFHPSSIPPVKAVNMQLTSSLFGNLALPLLYVAILMCLDHRKRMLKSVLTLEDSSSPGEDMMFSAIISAARGILVLLLFALGIAAPAVTAHNGKSNPPTFGHDFSVYNNVYYAWSAFLYMSAIDLAISSLVLKRRKASGKSWFYKNIVAAAWYYASYAMISLIFLILFSPSGPPGIHQSALPYFRYTLIQTALQNSYLFLSYTFLLVSKSGLQRAGNTESAPLQNPQDANSSEAEHNTARAVAGAPGEYDSIQL